jgi:hypothetical protein
MLSTIVLALLSQHPIAVLESGARVEASVIPEIGARRVLTAHGAYNASLDPVAAVTDAANDLELLAPLREMDYPAWLARVSERGLVSVIVADQAPAEYSAARLDALESLGNKLDRLPGDTDRNERVALLWKNLQRANDADQALLTGALLREISLSNLHQKRRISYADLSRALESKDPELRRAACRLAAHQLETSMQRRLAKLSVSDSSTTVRPVAAQAMMALDEERALGHWAAELWTARKDTQRKRAAEHLGNFGHNRPDVVKSLIYALGAAQQQVPGRYVFFGRQVSVVTDFDVEVAQAAFIADPHISVITEGTALQVRMISNSLSRSITGALQHLTNEDFGTDRAAWLRWYKAQQS